MRYERSKVDPDVDKSIKELFKREFTDYDKDMISKELTRENKSAIKYLKKNGLEDLIKTLMSQWDVSGCSLAVYAYLHKWIKANKPQYFLECGTGISTHVIADAMEKFCYDHHGGDIKLVSMENSSEWYQKAQTFRPRQRFVSICYSELIYTKYLHYSGVNYQSIPWFEYDGIFIDGPGQEQNNQVFVTTDLFTILSGRSNDKPVTAIVDLRVITCMAYLTIFGLTKFSRTGGVTEIGPISKSNIMADKNRIFIESLCRIGQMYFRATQTESRTKGGK